MVHKVVSEEEKVQKLVELRALLKSKEEEVKPSDSAPATTCDSPADSPQEENNTEDITKPTATQPYRGMNELLTDADCFRFFRARNFQLPATLDMILNWYVWYNTPLSGSTYTPRDMRRRALEEGDSQEAVYQELLPHSNLGVDKDGRPVYWEKTGLISSRFGKIKTKLTEDDIYNRHIYQQERAILRLENLSQKAGRPIEKQIIVFDLSDLSYSLDFTAINVMRRVLAIDQVCYPERLKYLFFINTPWFFTAIWSLFKSIIDPVTADKMKILGSDYKETLLKFIDADQTPVEFGGTKEPFYWQYPLNWPAYEFDNWQTQH